MLHFTSAMSGFSTDDIDAAEDFYTKLLGNNVSRNDMGMLMLDLPGSRILIYPKDDHQPAEYTVLNLEVSDIDTAIEELATVGISPVLYPGLTDDAGIARGLSVDRGPDIAWFKDPGGNIVSVLCGK